MSVKLKCVIFENYDLMLNDQASYWHLSRNSYSFVHFVYRYTNRSEANMFLNWRLIFYHVCVLEWITTIIKVHLSISIYNFNCFTIALYSIVIFIINCFSKFQFVELKGSVFKKFDKNNLFQVSCCDVRERFHLFALLFIVVVQTMKEYGWREGKQEL